VDPAREREEKKREKGRDRERKKETHMVRTWRREINAGQIKPGRDAGFLRKWKYQ